ncbi:MAG: regulator of sigma protease [Sphingomonadales bacterium]|nr:regulator of sigma protease [Sphingomonadales bacterium]
MSDNPGIPWTILSFLLVIGPLIFVHELGHYFVGRWFGVQADAFSIGFGREIVGWTDRRGTRWKVGWLPLGGYVKFAGDMNPAGQASPEWLALPAEERARTFQAKPVWQRFLVVLAGPATNFLAAILILTGFNLAYGIPQTPAVVGAFDRPSAAAQAGLRPGDRILRVDGKDIDRFEDIIPIVALKIDGPLKLEIDRQGRRFEVDVTPRMVFEKDQFGNEMRRPMLGIAPAGQVLKPTSPLGAVAASARQCWVVVATTIRGLGQIVTGRRSVKEMGGPLKIAKFSGEQASMGLLAFLWFLAVISINLGFINLLPIPMLDGGHLFFYGIEAVRRKPLRPEAQEWAFRTGLAALLALMILVTFNDLASFGLWSKLGGLID